MQAIILAAGMGRRLGEYTKDNTKCMLPVNGERLIDRVLRQLARHHLSRVLIVVGYKGQNVIDYIGHRYDEVLKIEFCNNPIYDKTNNIYSLSLVKEQMAEDDTLLIESDLIVADEMFDLLVDDPFPNLALVAKYETWMDGTMVCIDNDNNIVHFVPKQAFRYEDTPRYYKTVNIYKFSKEFSKNLYIPFLEAYVKALGNNEYYEQVLRVITQINRTGLKAKLVGNLPWYEIDDVQDKDIAETIFAKGAEKYDKYIKRYGGYWRFEQMLDFCNLKHPFFPTRKMVDEMKANFDRLLTEYPSGMFVNDLLAGKYFNIRQEHIVLGNGTAELIKGLLALIDGKVGVVYPTIEENLQTTDSSEIIKYVPASPDCTYTADDLMQHFAGTGIKALLLVNPDNPSGNFIPTDDVLRLLAWCRETGAKLILDESFVDFTDGGSVNSLLTDKMLRDNPHLVVVKSISDSYGMAGIRLGAVASSDERVINRVKKQISLWNINSVAEFYMQIFNKYEKDYKQACDKFRQERTRFYTALSSVPYLRVIPSQANFFLCEVTDKYSSHKLAEILLNRFNILIKDCEGKTELKGRNMVRISIRSSEENTLLMSALKELE